MNGIEEDGKAIESAKSPGYYSRPGQQNVVQAKCCIIGSKEKACGMTVEIFKSSPKAFWSHLEKHNKTEFFALQMAQVIMSLKTSFPVGT